jgi:predicted nucleic-acid-binding protein
MRAVDTNVVLRVITRDDAQQAVSADAFIAKGAWVSHVVLAEALWVLRSVHRLEHDQVAAAVDMLLNHESFTLQDADVVLAALESYRRRPPLGFTDCLVLEIARKAGHLPFGTFDKNLSRLDGAERL